MYGTVKFALSQLEMLCLNLDSLVCYTIGQLEMVQH